MKPVSVISFGAGDGDPLVSATATETIRVAGLEAVRLGLEKASQEVVWVLDSRARPEPHALETLLDSPSMPAFSLVVDGSREPVDAFAGRVDEGDAEAVLRAVQERRVPLRWIAPTSVLADREALLSVDAPDVGRFGGYAGIEWVVRLLRAGPPGFLVPASRVALDVPPWRSVRSANRMRAVRAWRGTEFVRELARIVGPP